MSTRGPGRGTLVKYRASSPANVDRPLVRVHVDEMLQPGGDPEGGRWGWATARLAHIDTVVPARASVTNASDEADAQPRLKGTVPL